jgi:hypothetical protein
MSKRKVSRTKMKDGPREVVSYACPSGIEDNSYYYNLIDYGDGMTDFVNLTRHSTLKEAIVEAGRFALDRRWAGPGTSSVYAGVPPRIVRTVRFIELHRVTVMGPLPRKKSSRE